MPAAADEESVEDEFSTTGPVRPTIVSSAPIHFLFSYMEGVSKMLRTVAAIAAALTLTLACAMPAQAASGPQVRVQLDAVDLAGAGVPNVTFTVWSSIDSATLTTDSWGHSHTKLDFVPGETIFSDSTDTRIDDAYVEYPDADDGERFDSEATVTIAQGFTLVWSLADLDGDTIYDNVWQQVRANASDRWIIDLSSGPVRDVRFASSPVVSVFSTNFTADPANELTVVEQLASGEYRLWVYSEVADDVQRVSLGALPRLWWLQDNFDGDGLNDILFYDDGATGAYQFTLAYSSTRRAAKFSMGTADAYLYEESQDVGGDGIKDVVVALDSPDIWTSWWVWDSSTRSVHRVDMGLHNGHPSTEGFNDGDHDGLAEFVSVADIAASSDRIWEVYEYASGEYFSVVLGPEDDRGPSSDDYPPSWFD